LAIVDSLDPNGPVSTKPGQLQAASEPEALVGLFRDLKLTFVRIGLEAGPYHSGCMMV